MHPDPPSFSAGVTSAKVGVEEHVFSIPVALLSKLGKGWEKEIRDLQCHRKPSETERMSD